MKASDLRIECINITPLLRKAYKSAIGGEARRQSYEIFNPSVVFDRSSREFVAAARVFISANGTNNRRSWSGTNRTVLTRLDESMTWLRGRAAVVHSLLDVAYRSSAIAKEKAGTEDVRLMLQDGGLWAVGNELVLAGGGKRRQVVAAELDGKTFRVLRSGVVCKSAQGDFEKNWSIYRAEGGWRCLYKLSPLETISIEGSLLEGKAEKGSHHPSILDEVVAAFERRVTGLTVEVRNRTSPVKVGQNSFLCMGGCVIDWVDADAKVNAILVPGVNAGLSSYDAFDSEYWGKKYTKQYTAFFFVFSHRGNDGKRVSIDAISSFFQLPTSESRDDLVCFPTTLTLKDDTVVCSFGSGDNRSYVCILPRTLVDLTLQSARSAVLFQTINVTPDELINTCRIARRANRMPDEMKDFLFISKAGITT